MSDLEDFTREVLPRLHHTEVALHDGDAGPRIEMWSHEDPVTLFGAAFEGRSWEQVRQIFGDLAERFSDCASCEWEVVAAGASGDLGYIVAIERTTCSIGGAPPAPYALRSTTVLRREDGVWRVVHRHADPTDAGSGHVLGRLTEPLADAT